MPQAYVKKLARKHGTTTRRAEGKWAKAKAAAASQGHDGNYAYVTSIFKNMMHETPYIPTLKDLTNGMSFKYFLVAEADEDNVSQKREQSPEWRHLSKFPQFLELPFKIRRELEQEVRADGLISDYEQLEPEEKESVDDALQDLVIDKMSKHFGTGINLANWNDVQPEPEPEETDVVPGDEPDAPADEPMPRRRAERAPKHIAAFRDKVETSPEQSSDEELPHVGTRKSYYKPWAQLSDDQRKGRAALAKKHGMLYRVKNSKWFRTLAPEKQQTIIDKLKSGEWSVEQAGSWAKAQGLSTVV